MIFFIFLAFLTIILNLKEKSALAYGFLEKEVKTGEVKDFLYSVSPYTSFLEEDPETVSQFLSEEDLLLSGGFLEKPNIVKTEITSPQPPLERKEIITYEVAFGDSLGKIAQKFDLRIKTLADSNNLTDLNKLKPKTTLLIPPADGIIVEVKKGDTLDALVKKYNGSFEETQKYSQENLKIGQKVFIAGGKAIPQPSPPKLAKAPRNVIVRELKPLLVEGGLFKRPVAGLHISQYFSRRHRGIDLNSQSGTTIYASGSGRVVSLSRGWGGGYGNHLIIDHHNGFQTLYAHLSQFLVSEGENVSAGQPIGIMGRTGWATGVHLHFEIHKGGVSVDPLGYLR